MSLLLAVSGAGGASLTQSLAATLDDVTAAVSQAANHPQALTATMDDVTVEIVQTATHASAAGSAGTPERYGMALDALIAEKNAAQAIARVAIKHVDSPAKPAKRKRQLKREIERSGLAWNAFYADLLNQARSQILTARINAEYEARRLDAEALQTHIAGLIAEQMMMDDDDAVLALLLCL